MKLTVTCVILHTLLQLRDCPQLAAVERHRLSLTLSHLNTDLYAQIYLSKGQDEAIWPNCDIQAAQNCSTPRTATSCTALSWFASIADMVVTTETQATVSTQANAASAEGEGWRS